ncbi:uncharacterized protein EKO05_0004807 [Ascochyta rabiei]|uniref:uncharacterized protein n=1 Tax=Didymella rabiei TaxID=5454 RepID=UPI00220E41A5|nr:uncharacterized protein EKO05_0004807 [Ascochyta rabiei]UPX14320.1 hypothetical protein EKO05_0004807 [Ascochyta rabiei]
MECLDLLCVKSELSGQELLRQSLEDLLRQSLEDLLRQSLEDLLRQSLEDLSSLDGFVLFKLLSDCYYESVGETECLRPPEHALIFCLVPSPFRSLPYLPHCAASCFCLVFILFSSCFVLFRLVFVLFLSCFRLVFVLFLSCFRHRCRHSPSSSKSERHS